MRDLPEAFKLLQPMVPFVLHQSICNNLHDFSPVGNTCGICVKLGIGCKFGTFEDLGCKLAELCTLPL